MRYQLQLCTGRDGTATFQREVDSLEDAMREEDRVLDLFRPICPAGQFLTMIRRRLDNGRIVSSRTVSGTMA